MKIQDETVIKLTNTIKTLDILSIAILLDILTNRLAELGRAQRAEENGRNNYNR